MQVEVVVVEPGKRAAEVGVHSPPSLLHALFDGVGQVADVGPGEAVGPLEQQLGCGVSCRHQADQVVGVSVLEHDLQGFRRREYVREELIYRDLLHTVERLFALRDAAGQVVEHVHRFLR